MRQRLRDFWYLFAPVGKEIIVKPGDAETSALEEQVRIARKSHQLSVLTLLLTLIFQVLNTCLTGSALKESQDATLNARKSLIEQSISDSIGLDLARQQLKAQILTNEKQLSLADSQLSIAVRSAIDAQKFGGDQLSLQKQVAELTFRPVLEVPRVMSSLDFDSRPGQTYSSNIAPDSIVALLKYKVHDLKIVNRGAYPLKVIRYTYSTIFPHEWEDVYREDVRLIVRTISSSGDVDAIVNDVTIFPSDTITLGERQSTPRNVRGRDLEAQSDSEDIKVTGYQYFYLVYADMWGKEYSLFRMSVGNIYLDHRLNLIRTDPNPLVFSYRWDLF